MTANLENSAVATGLGKVSFHSNHKERQCQRCSNYHTIALISHASKEILKILQASFQQYLNPELADAQAGFKKGRGTRDQIPNIHWIIQKAREFQKNKQPNQKVHWDDPEGWDGEGWFRMGNTCKPMADSYQCMAKTTTIL